MEEVDGPKGKKEEAQKRKRFWVFTEYDFETAKQWEELPHEHVRYMIWQFEKCSKTGRFHLQGYLELFETNRLSWLKKNVSGTAHWSWRRGTQEQAIHYCGKPHEGCDCKACKEERKHPTKQDGPWILGEKSPGQGARGDVIAFKELCKQGKRERDLWEEATFAMVKWPRMYERLNALHKPLREGQVHVTVAIGAHGTGKTHYGTYLDHPQAYLDGGVFVVPIARTSQWFTGYDHHEHVVFDDFDGRLSRMGLKELLRLTHNHVENVETKGGHVWWHPRTIFMTTNVRMENWYEWGERTWMGVKVRIHRILDFGDTEHQICHNPKDITATYDWERGIGFGEPHYGCYGSNQDSCCCKGPLKKRPRRM